MLDFATPHTNYEPAGDNRGRFVVEPLARGFGYTFGNSLRRVLLSSLEGAAISAVKITGVEHEFSTIPHVKEDVTDIILNLKKLVFRLHGEDAEHDVDLVKDTPGLVTAGDIQLPSGVDVIDPDAPIATLEQDGKLDMRLTIRRGRGYSSADENKGNDNIVGVIPIDSIFSPVVRVAYSVEPARVGQRTDFDKLTLEVETNGAIEPRAAVAKAATILRDELALFIDDPEKNGNGGSTDDDHETDPILEEPIDVLGLGVRALNSLKRASIETVGELVSKTESDLMELPNFGRKSIEDVREVLKKHGLYLKGDADEPVSIEEDDAPEAPEDDPILGMRIDELDLGVRSLNCLKREGVETVADLISRSEKELLCIPNFGRKSIEDVRDRLAKNNLKLRGD